MIMFVGLLITLLVTGLVLLGRMIYTTRGESVQPYDTVPYAQNPGDLTNQIMDSHWED